MKVGQGDLVVACSWFISMSDCQDYKSLCVAVMICATLVNIQTDRHTQTVFWTDYMNSSASRAKMLQNEYMYQCISNYVRKQHCVLTF